METPRTRARERGTDRPNLVGHDRARRKLKVQASVGLSYCSNYPTRNIVLDDVSIVGLIDTNKQTSLGATMRPSALEIVAKRSDGAEKTCRYDDVVQYAAGSSAGMTE